MPPSAPLASELMATDMPARARAVHGARAQLQATSPVDCDLMAIHGEN